MSSKGGMAKKGGWQEFSSTASNNASHAASTARPGSGKANSTGTSTGRAGATGATSGSGGGGWGGGTTAKAQQRVRVQRTKAGKGGKLVTAITGLEIPEAEARALLKTLKASAGTGGTLKDGVIELQGDQVAPALAALEKEGFRPKQAGG
jgi:translation initiation factor 1